MQGIPLLVPRTRGIPNEFDDPWTPWTQNFMFDRPGIRSLESLVAKAHFDRPALRGGHNVKQVHFDRQQFDPSLAAKYRFNRTKFTKFDN